VERHENDCGGRGFLHGCPTNVGAQLSELSERRVVGFAHDNIDGKHPRVTPPAGQDARDTTSSDEPDPLLCVIHVVLTPGSVRT